MKTGAGLALICIGAILAFAVTANPPYFNIHVAGSVLILIGLIGLVAPRRTYGWLGRRMLVRRTRTWPDSERVETVAVPPYLARNPGTSRLEAGLPPASPLDDRTPADEADAAARRAYVRGSAHRPPAGPWIAPSPEDTEVIEDLYEQ